MRNVTFQDRNNMYIVHLLIDGTSGPLAQALTTAPKATMLLLAESWLRARCHLAADLGLS